MKGPGKITKEFSFCTLELTNQKVDLYKSSYISLNRQSISFPINKCSIFLGWITFHLLSVKRMPVKFVVSINYQRKKTFTICYIHYIILLYIKKLGDLLKYQFLDLSMYKNTI